MIARLTAGRSRLASSRRGATGPSSASQNEAAVTDARTLRRVLRNSGVLVGGDVTGKLFRFAAALVLARALGPSEFGIVNLGIAAAGTLAIASALGLPDVASREVAMGASAAAAVGGRVIAARVLVAALGGLAVFAVVIAVDPHDAGLAGAALALAVVAGCSLDWLLRGLSRVRPVAVATSSAGASALLVAVIVALSGAGPTFALAGFALAEAIAAAICWSACRPGERPRLALSGLRPLLHLSWPVAVAGFAFYIYYANFDTIILASFGSTAQAGIYSAAYRVFLGLNVVGGYVSFASLPFLSRLLAEPRGHERADRLLKDTTGRLAVYGVIVVGGAALGAAPALELLFGTRYRSAAGALILLCVALAWYSATYPVGYALIAERRNRGYMYGALVGGGLNIALCLALIPWAGMTGAAIATIVSFASAALVWLRLRAVSHSRWLLSCLVGLTALACAAVAIPPARAPVGAALVALGLGATFRIRRGAIGSAADSSASRPALADSTGSPH